MFIGSVRNTSATTSTRQLPVTSSSSSRRPKTLFADSWSNCHTGFTAFNFSIVRISLYLAILLDAGSRLQQRCRKSENLDALFSSQTTSGLFAEGKVVATQLSQRVVSTRYGQLRGILVTLPVSSGSPISIAGLPQVEAYLGVEYGSLLGGELRFMPPTSPVLRWDGIRAALKFRPVCPQPLPHTSSDTGSSMATSGPDAQTEAPSLQQLSVGQQEQLKRLRPYLERQNEECLSMNIYVPVPERNTSRSLVPVVLFIHGFSYEIGTGNAYDGSVMAAFGRVIVITMNYRLGVLGFLSTGDRHAPGNYALLDIVAALHWIADNIREFGGDPDQVTLLGQGHGAALVNLLILSPVTKGKGLFHRAILQGGSALASWAVQDEPLRYTHEVAQKLNCTRFPDGGLLMHCLKQFNVNELIQASYGSSYKYLARWGPNVDGHWLLTSHPRNLMSGCHSNSWATIPLLIGTSDKPGYGLMTPLELEFGISEWDMTRHLRTYIQNTFRRNRQTVYDVIAHNYAAWDWPRDRKRLGDQLAALLGDGQILAPTVEAARFHADCRLSNQTKRLQQQLQSSTTYLFSIESARLGTTWNGNQSSAVDRVPPDELIFVFGSALVAGVQPYVGYQPTPAEKVISETVLGYWSNFIRTGNPNAIVADNNGGGRRMKSNGAGVDLMSISTRKQWPTYNTTSQKYLSIGPSGSTVSHHFRSDKMALWLELIPRLQRPDGSASAIDQSSDWLDDLDNITSFDPAGGTRFVDPPSFQTGGSWTTPTRLSAATSNDTSGRRSLGASFLTTFPAAGTPSTARRPAAENRHQLASTKLQSVTGNVLNMPETGSMVSAEAVWTIKVTAVVGVLMATLNLVVFVAAARQWHRLRQIRRKTRTKGFHQLLDHQPPSEQSASAVDTSQVAMTAAAGNHCIEPADEIFKSARSSEIDKRSALVSSADPFQRVTDQLVDAWLLHNSSYTDGDVSCNQEHRNQSTDSDDVQQRYRTSTEATMTSAKTNRRIGSVETDVDDKRALDVDIMELIIEKGTEAEIESFPRNSSLVVDPNTKSSWSVSYASHGGHSSKNTSHSELYRFSDHNPVHDTRISSLKTGKVKVKTPCSCSSSNNSRQGSAVVLFDCSNGGTKIADDSESINHADVLSGSNQASEREPNLALSQSPVGPDCSSSSYRSDFRQQNTQPSVSADLCIRRTGNNENSLTGQGPSCRGDVIRRQSATNDRMDLEILSNSSGSECPTHLSKSLDRASITIVQCNSTVV